MGKLIDLTFYNPSQLNDEDFVRGFVARQDLVEKILASLSEITSDGLAKHRLILGQRGMGKTSLLRRIAIGVSENVALSSTLLPLTFREEQYNVHNLHVFWCNCLDALGDRFEAQGMHEKADRVDKAIAALDSRADDDEGSEALGVFKQLIKAEGKRPLLMLDNIDLVFNGLRDKQWSLRRVLQERGGIVVIGATSTFLEATTNPEAAFYEFFQVDVLQKLGQEELFSCLRKLADERGEAGKKVTAVLSRDPARIRVLYDLTGGNPRTLTMLYIMLEMREDGDLMRDLERLLDQATPLYKARVEQLSAQARVVFDAVALNWNPIIAADAATTTGLAVGTVSAQLNRMEKDGIVEKASLSSTNRAGFQVAERFFNIWYLMRHAPRRQRNRLRWLTEFLRSFYTKSEQTAEIQDNNGIKLKKQAVEKLPPHEAGLLKAYRALSNDNFGDATSELKVVLETGHAELFSDYYIDLLRVLWLAEERGYGEKLLKWFEESGLKDLYWPLWAAFDAHILGEERLNDVNPEVRSAAERILAKLASRPKSD